MPLRDKSGLWILRRAARASFIPKRLFHFANELRLSCDSRQGYKGSANNRDDEDSGPRPHIIIINNRWRRC